MSRALLVAAVLVAPLAGCVDEGTQEQPIAIYDLTDFQGSANRTFEITYDVAYWRVDLSARIREDVTYVAEGPDGARHWSERGGFPYEHQLRVDNPKTGEWTVTVNATRIVDGELRILVPVG